MKLTCLGSGSAGNCYLLHNDTECLVIEAGVPFKEVKKALDFNVSKIVGLIYSHVHLDHGKYADEYGKAGIPVIRHFNSLSSNQPLMDSHLGGFHIKPFECVHDAPCVGFLIEHKDIGRLLFATDTEYIKYRFRDLNHIMIECNYSLELLNQAYHEGLQERIKLTHMELETCKDFITANRNEALKTVCLMHLSDRTSDEKMFQREVQELVTRPVYVASKGLEYEL